MGCLFLIKRNHKKYFEYKAVAICNGSCIPSGKRTCPLFPNVRVNDIDCREEGKIFDTNLALIITDVNDFILKRLQKENLPMGEVTIFV